MNAETIWLNGGENENLAPQDSGTLWAYLKAAPIAGRNILLGANLASLTLAFQPRRWLHYCNSSLFMLRTLSGTRGLPQKQLWQVFPQLAGDVKFQLPRVEASWISPDPSFLADMVNLAMLCEAVQPQRVFEIGTFLGYTALLFAANTPEGAQVFTLDLPPNAEAGDASFCQLKPTALDHELICESRLRPICFRGHKGEEKITRLFGDSATFDFSPYAGAVDLFFVDGAHSYAYVRSDTLRAMTCCHPGSVLAWHDYGRAGLSRDVSRCLEEMARDHAIYSVPGSSVAYMVYK